MARANPEISRYNRRSQAREQAKPNRTNPARLGQEHTCQGRPDKEQREDAVSCVGGAPLWSGKLAPDGCLARATDRGQRFVPAGASVSPERMSSSHRGRMGVAHQAGSYAVRPPEAGRGPSSRTFHHLASVPTPRVRSIACGRSQHPRDGGPHASWRSAPRGGHPQAAVVWRRREHGPRRRRTPAVVRKRRPDAPRPGPSGWRDRASVCVRRAPRQGRGSDHL
jgi:hypothetical protein